MLLLGKGSVRTHHWHCHREWQHHSEEPTSWPIKIYYSSPKTKQLETHTCSSSLRGRPGPGARAVLKVVLGQAPGSAGAQELSTSHLTANGHPEHAAAESSTPDPLAAPPSPSVHSISVLLPQWATPSQKRLEQQGRALRGGRSIQEREHCSSSWQLCPRTATGSDPSVSPAHPACGKPAHAGKSCGINSPCPPRRTSGSTVFQLSGVKTVLVVWFCVVCGC